MERSSSGKRPRRSDRSANATDFRLLINCKDTFYQIENRRNVKRKYSTKLNHEAEVMGLSKGYVRVEWEYASFFINAVFYGCLGNNPYGLSTLSCLTQ